MFCFMWPRSFFTVKAGAGAGSHVDVHSGGDLG